MTHSVDVAFDLLMSEVEFHQRNAATARLAVASLLTTGTTLQVLLASASFRSEKLSNEWPLAFVCLMLSIGFCAVGIRQLWFAAGSIQWPESSVLLAGEGSPSDMKREMFSVVDAGLGNARALPNKLRRGLVCMSLVFVGSILAWGILMVKTAPVGP